MAANRLLRFRWWHDPRTAAPGRSSAFVLLEVTVAIVIMGIAAAVALRSFILSMHATREIEIAMRASLLAQTLMETFELVPPEHGKDEGSFGSDPAYGSDYRFYFWRTETEEIGIDYEDITIEGLRRDLVPLKQVRLEIYYDDGLNRRFRPIDVTTYVLDLDPFSQQARQENQLF